MVNAEPSKAPRIKANKKIRPTAETDTEEDKVDLHTGRVEDDEQDHVDKDENADDDPAQVFLFHSRAADCGSCSASWRSRGLELSARVLKGRLVHEGQRASRRASLRSRTASLRSSNRW